MTDESTVFDAAFEYRMNGMSEESARVAASEDEAKDARIAQLEAALKSAMGALGDIHDGEPEWPDDDKKELAWCRNRAFTTIAAIKANEVKK
jgi:hypothetical protein